VYGTVAYFVLAGGVVEIDDLVYEQASTPDRASREAEDLEPAL